jgi:uncharacterized cupredoxin-like copper-binding protein
MLIRATIVSVSLATVVAVGTPAQAGLRVTTVRVSTHNARFVLSTRTAPRGVVIFKVTNPSQIVHYFSIKGRTTPLLNTGQSATLRVTFLRKGRYPYEDTFDHHASFGEKGIFTIT